MTPPLDWQDPTLYVIGVEGRHTVWASKGWGVFTDGDDITHDEWDELFQRTVELSA